jgi:signal transduction histidine kinase
VIGESLIKEIEARGSDLSPTRLTAERDDGNLVFRKITNYPAYIVLGLDLKAILAEWYRHLAIYGLIAVGAALGIVLALRFALKRAHEERRAVAELQREMHERESVQEQLRQIDRAQEIAGIGSWELNIASGRYTWSRQHYRIHGLQLDHQPTLGTLMSGLHTDDAPLLSEWLINLQAGREREPIEIRISRPEGGEMRVLRLDGRPIIDPDGAIRRLTGTTQDVTERRLIQRQLMQAQKMEAIGNLTGGMAHDFNNLLGVMILNLGVAQKMLPVSDRARQLVVDALAAARSGADLIRSLLAFARRQPLSPSRIEINEQVSNMFSLLSRVVREDIEISLDLSPNLWPVIADPAQFEACIVNLATNARDAMPNGGKLTIVTGNQHLDADYVKLNPSVTPGDYAMITVSDTGTGMTAEVIAKVFDPFFTTKEQGKGTGLGLSMVFGFTNQSGGHVSIYSEPGLGTTIRLFLPRAADTVEPRVPAHALRPIAAEKGRGETVLVVEDNAAMRQAVVQQLALLNYRVLGSASAPGALAMLANERIDLVFSDVVMPGGMDGFDLAERVGRQWPAVRVLMTSGFLPGTARVRRDGPESSSRFLNKPYDQEQLTRAVRETLDA